MRSFILTILSIVLFLQVNATCIYNNIERKYIPLNKDCTYKPNKGRSGIEIVQAYIEDGDLYIETKGYIGTMPVIIYNDKNEIVYTSSFEIVEDDYKLTILNFQKGTNFYYLEITTNNKYSGSFSLQ